MTKKIAFRVFLLGTIVSSIVFLAATWDTHRQIAVLSNADGISDRVVAGKRAFQKYNCNDCHTILGFGAYYAPDLTRVIRRIGTEGVVYRVMNPGEAFARSWRKMPDLGVADAEAADMAEFFRWVGEINNNDWPPQDSVKRLSRGEQAMVATVGVHPGAAVFQTRGCMNCHSLHGAGGSFGPPLDTIGRTLSLEQIEHYVTDPKSVNPAAKMPPQKELSAREVEEVAGFLSKLK